MYCVLNDKYGVSRQPDCRLVWYYNDRYRDLFHLFTNCGRVDNFFSKSLFVTFLSGKVYILFQIPLYNSYGGLP